ncbi:TPA_asm: fusion protein [Phalaenopsis equestris amalgavirus 2]|nr:TPA_asm: fusion protein [Phalaenopsis equestris amalgavirus 2]
MSRRGKAHRPGPSEVRGMPADDSLEVITRYRTLLGALSVPAECFDPKFYLAGGLQPKAFAKLLRVIPEFEKLARMEQLFYIGVSRRLFPSVRGMKPQQFYDFLHYLKTPQGQDEVNKIQLAIKFEKRGGGYFEPHQVGKIAMIEAQRGDCITECNDLRRDYDARIAQQELLLRKLRAEKDDAIHAVTTKYRPFADISVLPVAEFNKLCWEEYLDNCRIEGHRPKSLNTENLEEAVHAYSDIVRQRHILNELLVGNRQEELERWVAAKIGRFDVERETKKARRFEASWKQWALDYLMRFPLTERRRLMSLIPVGKPRLQPDRGYSRQLTRVITSEVLQLKRQMWRKPKPTITRRTELSLFNLQLLFNNSRLRLLRPLSLIDRRGIPVARSKWEAGVRKVIGGGEMIDWESDSSKYRGGGCFADAMRLLADANEEPPGRLLRNHYTLPTARRALLLPDDLTVPDSKNSCFMKNFNNDATSGPLLFSFGCKFKAGLSQMLSDVMWSIYNDYANELIDDSGLPFFCGRIGFRTKLIPISEALEKLRDGKAIGRCVIMMDALEQAASSPLYNVLVKVAHEQIGDPLSGFRNTVVRASTDWMKLWDEIRKAAVVVELDWKKFDRERPAEDILFIVDVIISCFRPRTPREERLLRAYAICMRRALVQRHFITDAGMVIEMDGMVPSGTLWTGFIDTALNILYISSALLDMGFSISRALPKCCGDDNLTLFFEDPGDLIIRKLRTKLNSYFRAGIEEEDFIITRPPYHVTTEQAWFPVELNLSSGTSKYLDQATWIEFDDDVIVDESIGRSHRWRYNFFRKPKFLSCYWLPSGLPIRPAKDNLEKLLFPEAIHDSIDEYEAAILGMVVDNPFNHHNVNHLKHRYLIIQQIKRQAVLGIDPYHIMKFCKIRSVDGEAIPFPDVAVWRRQNEYLNLDNYAPLRRHVSLFNDFVAGVTSLYSRAATGGLDAYKFIDLVRGDVTLGEGQWGNDVKAWLKFIQEHPITKYLKKTKRYRGGRTEKAVENKDIDKGQEALVTYCEKLRRGEFKTTEDYSLWLANILH